MAAAAEAASARAIAAAFVLARPARPSRSGHLALRESSSCGLGCYFGLGCCGLGCGLTGGQVGYPWPRLHMRELSADADAATQQSPAVAPGRVQSPATRRSAPTLFIQKPLDNPCHGQKSRPAHCPCTGSGLDGHRKRPGSGRRTRHARRGGADTTRGLFLVSKFCVVPSQGGPRGAVQRASKPRHAPRRYAPSAFHCITGSAFGAH